MVPLPLFKLGALFVRHISKYGAVCLSYFVRGWFVSLHRDLESNQAPGSPTSEVPENRCEIWPGDPPDQYEAVSGIVA
jgi:hypothetical protein